MLLFNSFTYYIESRMYFMLLLKKDVGQFTWFEYLQKEKPDKHNAIQTRLLLFSHWLHLHNSFLLTDVN